MVGTDYRVFAALGVGFGDRAGLGSRTLYLYSFLASAGAGSTVMR